MCKEDNLFNSIPKELTHIIINYIEADKAHPDYRNNTVLTCSMFYNHSQQRERLRQALAHYVTSGNVGKAKIILEKYPELLLATGPIIDKSGRFFEEIPVWIYVIWAMDVRYMATMMINCLPKNEIGEKIRTQLQTLLRHHQTHGVTYILEGVSYTEAYYDWSIIKKLEICLSDGNMAGTNYDCWYIDVSKAQQLLPAHVAQHYCDPTTPFTFMPFFAKNAMKPCLDYFNESSQKRINWYAKLEYGDPLPRIRWKHNIPIASVDVPVHAMIYADFKALCLLSKKRENDLNSLINLLDVPLFQPIQLTT